MAENWNGGENPMGIDKIEIAGHGYPCSSIEVAKYEQTDLMDEYKIFLP